LNFFEQGAPFDSLEDDADPTIDLDQFKRGRRRQSGVVNRFRRLKFLFRFLNRAPAMKHLKDATFTPGEDVGRKTSSEQHGIFKHGADQPPDAN
jgi:hypothetical protein